MVQRLDEQEVEAVGRPDVEIVGRPDVEAVGCLLRLRPPRGATPLFVAHHEGNASRNPSARPSSRHEARNAASALSSPFVLRGARQRA